ncbi:hypothetical protein G9A89_009362 [Geosiphon pyriformis]|nr:hypothetical protein G9A89_009362 [Geosiphon pyriformis]
MLQARPDYHAITIPPEILLNHNHLPAINQNTRLVTNHGNNRHHRSRHHQNAPPLFQRIMVVLCVVTFVIVEIVIIGYWADWLEYIHSFLDR